MTVDAHDYETAGKPACAWDDPAARDELVTGLVNDARAILDAVAGVALDDDQQALVGLLALVAGQDVEEGDTPGSWRIARKVVKDRTISTVDPETRHMHKSRSNYRDGYKAHLAVEPETGIITGVDLTPANAGDGPAGVALLDDEEPGLEVLGDSAYGSGPVRADLAAAGHTAVIKPWPTARNPQLDDDQFHRDDFRIDYRPAPSPAPTTSPSPSPTEATPTSGRAAAAARCAPAAPPTATAECSTSASTTNCSPPPEPNGGPGPASMTTGNGGPWSNALSPGSSLTATAESATAASNATGSASASAPPPSTCDASSTSASPTPTTAGTSPPDSGPGADNEATTPSAISHPARPTHTLHIGSSVGHVPGPTTTLRPPRTQRKRPLLSSLLRALTRTWSVGHGAPGSGAPPTPRAGGVRQLAEAAVKRARRVALLHPVCIK